ncbi:MAG: orotidine-5-phosphate decarboxylase [Candidatus Hydrogenedentes bacterium]|nr:orotidine-5-phosphate decarboxylase [Candidatus Hydrogenedentota bacterium]
MTTELIVVLDVDKREEALHTVETCAGCQWFKIGSQLFTRCGPDIVHEIREMGKKVFLDLKFHDIPNTVAKAAHAAAALGVHFITIHAVGGRRMIETARKAVDGTNTHILAVTVLTSLSDDMLHEEVGIPQTAAEAVPRLARMAFESGAHGVVCSPQEIRLIRDSLGRAPIIVAPGIRPAWASTDDQSRVMTPREAAQAGADYIVVGRPILKHEHPAEAVRLIREELNV